MFSRSLRRLAACAVALLPSAVALHAAVPNRLGSLSGDNRSPIAHMVPRRAMTATDLGQAPLDRVLTSVTFHFNMSAAQQTALNQLLVDQQNPASPRYHHWLTPAQFGSQFGLSSADLAKAKAWLVSQGLTVTAVSPSSNFISVSGTVGQVQKALGTSIHTLSSDGEQHFSNVGDPVLPAALTSVLNGITGLNDFKLKPRAIGRLVHPNFTSSLTNNHYLAPGDFYTIYDVSPLLTNSINGTGITIAVMGQTDILLSDVAAFRSASGLSTNQPTVKLIGTDPGTSTNDIPEASLDVEWSGAVAPAASILYVNSTDVIGISLINAITSNLAPILSVSYGACEADWGQSHLISLNQYFQQANAQGQTIVGPGGDTGATDCDYQSTTAADGLAVDFPASSPFVTGAGGTIFNEGAGSYWNSSNGTNQGSATGYIPEAAWNETSATNGLAAGGGGTSAFFAKPAWQVGSGVPADLSRDVPDIALNAAFGHDGYLYCVQGSCVTGYRGADGQTLSVVGGTSASVPSFAGILALVEQKTGSRIGNANPQIYGLANSTFYNNVFHDITIGNNNSPCVQGSPDCASGGTIGYSASTGYDLVTGWGTIDAFNFVNQWGLVASTGTGSNVGANATATVVTTSAATCGITTGSIALNATITSPVTGAPIAPGGSVQFLVDNVAVGSPVALANGAAAYTLDTTALSSGGHTVSAVYLGDANYAGSKGSLLTDVVSTSQPDFSITPCTSTASVASGATAAGITFSVNPFNGFTGPVAMTATSDSTLSASYTFSVTPVTISGGTSGTTVFTLSAYQTDSKTTNGLIKLGKGGQTTASLGGKHSAYVAGSGVALASLLLLTVPRRRRWGALLAVVLSAGALGASGCGSGATTLPGGTTPPATTTTPATPGTYTVTVVGVGTSSSGTRVHSVQVTLKVM